MTLSRAGAGTASSVLLLTARELQGKEVDTTIPALYKEFKLLVSLEILER
jgi:hypothetical protein